VARRPDYAFSLCLALEMAAMLHQLSGEPAKVIEFAGEMQTLAVEGGLPYRQATAGVLLGWARSALGEPAGAVVILKWRWLDIGKQALPASCHTF
jgi:hypothetical protein